LGAALGFLQGWDKWLVWLRIKINKNYSKLVSQGAQARHDAAVVMLLDEEPLPF